MKYITILFLFFGCSRNVEFIKERASYNAKELGYELAGYEGYQWSLEGGDVWYQFKRTDSPGILYHGFFRRWGDELHLYEIKVISGQQVQLNER